MKKEIENWWKQAEADLKSAKNSLNSGDYYASVFWCQQAIEKSFKALYINKLRENPKGHSIIYFAQKLNVPKDMLSGIRELNPEYLITRYPDIAAGIPAEMYDKEINIRHYQTAERVLKWIKNQIQG